MEIVVQSGLNGATEPHFHFDNRHWVYLHLSIVRDLQSVVGLEAGARILEEKGHLPDYLETCVGSGTNTLGLKCGDLVAEWLDERC